jgi:hypothetical protein
MVSFPLVATPIFSGNMESMLYHLLSKRLPEKVVLALYSGGWPKISWKKKDRPHCWDRMGKDRMPATIIIIIITTRDATTIVARGEVEEGGIVVVVVVHPTTTTMAVEKTKGEGSNENVVGTAATRLLRSCCYRHQCRGST